MIHVILFLLPVLALPVVFLRDHDLRLLLLRSYAAFQLLLSVALYALSSRLLEVPAGALSVTPLGAAFLLSYSGLQFVALLTLPRSNQTSSILFGTVLLSFCTNLTILAVDPVVWLTAFVASLFLPYACALLERRDHKSERIFLGLGMLCSALTIIGALEGGLGIHAVPNTWLMLAGIIRLGIVPCHLWVRRMVLNMPLQWSVLFFLSYPSIELLLRVSEGGHSWIFIHLSWITALYGAWIGIVQVELRKMFYSLLLSFLGAIGVGLTISTDSTALSGLLIFWLTGGIAIAGLGLIIEILEARFGQLHISNSQGLLTQVPLLGAIFLLFGLASVGFPGMCTFIGDEIMLSGIYEKTGWTVFPIALALTLNGITILHWFLSLFYGKPTDLAVNVELLRRERIAFILLLAIMLGTGIFPKPLFQFTDKAHDTQGAHSPVDPH